MTAIARPEDTVITAYRDHGIDAIGERPRGGSQPKLDPQAQIQFIERFKAGPVPETDGGKCTLRGKDAVRILADEHGVNYSLSGVYKILHRHHLACLKPRPQHRHNDPQAMQQWLEDAPLLSSASGSSTTTRPSKSGSRTKPLRPARHADPRLGREGLTSAGGAADRIRLVLPLRGGQPDQR